MEYFTINNREFYSNGKLIKICALVNGWYEDVEKPAELIESIKRSKKRNHIFTFFQRVPFTVPKYDFYMESYPAAVIQVNSYDDWWKNRIGRKARQAIKISDKKGVKVNVVAFDTEYIKGISDIYNETPIRAGKKFPHYKDSLEKVKKENETFFGRSAYFGAYHGCELVGFARVIFEEKFADILQLLSKISHRDKCVNNALLAKIVEVCARRQVNYIAYGDFDLSSLNDFKRHNGFLRMDLPRYYIPLNAAGLIALKLRLHRQFSQWLPDRMMHLLRNLRKRWYEIAFTIKVKGAAE
jgi:hypothetical protein